MARANGKTILSGKVERHVVGHRIGHGAFLVQKKWAAHILEIIRPGNSARHPNARDDLGGAGHTMHDPGFSKFSGLHEIGRDAPCGAFRRADELSLCGRRMKPKSGFGRGFECVRQPGNMIVVPVAEHNRIRLPEIDAEFRGIFFEHHSLTGVEEHALCAGLKPVGEPVFAEQPGPAHGVIGKDRQGNHFLSFS
jgi:hypothetical protein